MGNGAGEGGREMEGEVECGRKEMGNGAGEGGREREGGREELAGGDGTPVPVLELSFGRSWPSLTCCQGVNGGGGRYRETDIYR